MAKQKGAIKLSGTLGDISFYQSNNKFLAREKTGPTRKEVLTRNNFERTRENGLEFGHCSRMGKVLRSALGLNDGTHPDTTLTNRLAARLVKVMHSDTGSPRGQRRAHRGELSILEGFEFLEGARLAEGFLARYEVIFNREEGTCTLHVPSFMPTACIGVPPHATFVRLVATALALDGERLSVQKVMCTSDPLRLDYRLTDPLTLTCRFQEPTNLPLLFVLGLQFLEQYEGFCYPLREKEYNAMAVVGTEGRN